MNEPIRIGLVDDHSLVRKLLANFIDTFEKCKVMLQAENGKDLVENMNPTNLPDILLLDVAMPVMNGFEVAEWVQKYHPEVRILILSMHEEDLTLIRLIHLGARGFLNKDIDPGELERAILATMTMGEYYGPNTGRIIRLIKNGKSNTPSVNNLILTANEIRFLELASTERTYKQIALEMGMSPRTVENYRDSLFVKLDVNTRIGLALKAFRSGLVRLDPDR